MTRYVQDILRQPDELQRTLEYLSGAGRQTLNEAGTLLRKVRHVYLPGIVSSWHAAMAAAALFNAGGRPVHLYDAVDCCTSLLFRRTHRLWPSPAPAEASRSCNC